MRREILSVFGFIALGVVFTTVSLPHLYADDSVVSADGTFTQSSDEIDMIVGDIQTVKVNSLSRVSVTNPEIADISDAKGDKVSLMAKKAGKTVLFLWDADGKRSVKVSVVNEDLSAVKDRVEKMLNEANITGVSFEENSDIGKVVVTGDLSKDDKDRMESVLQPEGDNILNLVKVENSQDLIQVDMQIVEISTTLEKNLGILWGTASTSSGTSSSSSSSSSSGSGTTSTNSGSVALGYNENLPTGHTFGDLFKIGSFQRTSPLVATVNALLQEGKARLLSKPRLVVVSGKQASFLVGGEIPINTTTTSTTGSTLTQNTSYTQYGVNLTVTPTIHNRKIDVLLDVDIRDIDAANSSGGNTAFITRKAATDLMMDNKQTIVLAGLIKYSDSEQVTSIPVLSKIPILGALFRNKTTPSADTNTEMVIILTPTVITDEKFSDEQVVMPTPSERVSNDEFQAKYEHEPLSSTWPAAKPVVPAQSAPETFSDEATAYARMVQEKISRCVSYPPSAAGALTGTVRLRLHILKDGSLDSEDVTESSGNNLLDQDAMQAARAAAPFDAFTTGMDQADMVLTVPIVYNKMIIKQKTSPAPTEKASVSY